MPRSEIKELRDHCVALQTAMDASRNSRTDDAWLHSSFKTFMRKYNELVHRVRNVMQAAPPVDLFDLDKIPSAFDSVTIQQRIFFDEVYTNLLILRSFVEANGGLTEIEAENILNFLKANLRKVSALPQAECYRRDPLPHLKCYSWGDAKMRPPRLGRHHAQGNVCCRTCGAG